MYVYVSDLSEIKSNTYTFSNIFITKHMNSFEKKISNLSQLSFLAKKNPSHLLLLFFHFLTADRRRRFQTHQPWSPLVHRRYCPQSPKKSSLLRTPPCRSRVGSVFITRRSRGDDGAVFVFVLIF